MKQSPAMPMSESSTVSEKVLIMGALPEPDEVKEMSRRIDQILEILRIQNSLLCQLLPQSAKMSSDLKELAGLESKLDAIDNALSLIKKFVRFK
jgi:hypothetical protein